MVVPHIDSSGRTVRQMSSEIATQSVKDTQKEVCNESEDVVDNVKTDLKSNELSKEETCAKTDVVSDQISKEVSIEASKDEKKAGTPYSVINPEWSIFSKDLKPKVETGCGIAPKNSSENANSSKSTSLSSTSYQDNSNQSSLSSFPEGSRASAIDPIDYLASSENNDQSAFDNSDQGGRKDQRAKSNSMIGHGGYDGQGSSSSSTSPAPQVGRNIPPFRPQWKSVPPPANSDNSTAIACEQGGSSSSSSSIIPLKIVSYNVLADGDRGAMSHKHDYALREIRVWKDPAFNHPKYNAKNRNLRLHRTVQRLLEFDADIICLQECHKLFFHDFMSMEGISIYDEKGNETSSTTKFSDLYSGYYVADFLREDEKSKIKRHDEMDNVMLVRRSLISDGVIDVLKVRSYLFKAHLTDKRHTGKNRKRLGTLEETCMFLRIMVNVPDPNAKGGNPGAVKKIPVLIGNTHLYWDPRFPQAKASQAELFVNLGAQEARDWAPELDDDHVHIIFSGDLNTICNFQPCFCFEAPQATTPMASGAQDIDYGRYFTQDVLQKLMITPGMDAAKPWGKTHEYYTLFPEENNGSIAGTAQSIPGKAEGQTTAAGEGTAAVKAGEGSPSNPRAASESRTPSSRPAFSHEDVGTEHSAWEAAGEIDYVISPAGVTYGDAPTSQSGLLTHGGMGSKTPSHTTSMVSATATPPLMTPIIAGTTIPGILPSTYGSPSKLPFNSVNTAASTMPYNTGMVASSMPQAVNVPYNTANTTPYIAATHSMLTTSVLSGAFQLYASGTLPSHHPEHPDSFGKSPDDKAQKKQGSMGPMYLVTGPLKHVYSGHPPTRTTKVPEFEGWIDHVWYTTYDVNKVPLESVPSVTSSTSAKKSNKKGNKDRSNSSSGSKDSSDKLSDSPQISAKVSRGPHSVMVQTGLLEISTAYMGYLPDPVEPSDHLPVGGVFGFSIL